MEDITILVNKENLLDEFYIPEELYQTDNNENNFHNYKDPNSKPQISITILPYLQELIASAKKDGLDIIVDSGYRSFQYQQVIYDKILEEKGIEHVKKYVAPPGSSEHQTGLAVDFAFFKDGVYCDDVKEDDEVAIWLKDNAHKYGFILRYPKGKESITGYNFEPWHYRFVGLELSNYIYENNITLEEYYLLKSKTMVK